VANNFAGGYRAADAWRRALEMTSAITQNPLVTLPDVIEERARKFETKPALLSGGENLSYRALAEQARRYAHWALQQGLKTGDVVCLLMQNRPGYMAIWLGITRIGGIVALLNTNLVRASLEHSIKLVMPKHIIVGIELLDAFRTVRPHLGPEIGCWTIGDEVGHDPYVQRINTQIEEVADSDLHGLKYRRPPLRDKALYIYTSGTTGMPKAAAVSHFRLMQWSHWFAGLIDIQQSDRMYNCLPMYHSVGGVVATGAALVGGGSVVVREGFSASQFWSDVDKGGCTLFQYIGELCRYLVNSPPHPRETAHRLRLCCGSGRPRTGSGCVAAMGCAPTCGARSKLASTSRKYSTSTPRLKLTSRSTIVRESRAP
jgi:fatty-acyl-CoA synthase